MPQIFYFVPAAALVGERDRLLHRARPGALVRVERALARAARPGVRVRCLRAAPDRRQAALRRLAARFAARIPLRPAAEARAGGLERLARRRRRRLERDDHPPPVALVVRLGLDLDEPRLD